MITASFTLKPGTDEYTTCKVQGNNAFATYGYETVSASVSALVIASINALEDYVGLNTEVTVTDEYTKFTVTPIDEFTTIQAQAIMHTLEMGITDLSDEYDDFIKVEIKEQETDGT
jgi:uncharacterized protein YsxB (DUF464 family)